MGSRPERIVRSAGEAINNSEPQALNPKPETLTLIIWALGLWDDYISKNHQKALPAQSEARLLGDPTTLQTPKT